MSFIPEIFRTVEQPDPKEPKLLRLRTWFTSKSKNVRIAIVAVAVAAVLVVTIPAYHALKGTSCADLRAQEARLSGYVGAKAAQAQAKWTGDHYNDILACIEKGEW